MTRRHFLRQLALAAGGTTLLDWVGSTLTVLDPNTLKVTFEQPYPAFIGGTVG